jgi:hypothetical protein
MESKCTAVDERLGSLPGLQAIELQMCSLCRMWDRWCQVWSHWASIYWRSVYIPGCQLIMEFLLCRLYLIVFGPLFVFIAQCHVCVETSCTVAPYYVIGMLLVD